MEKPIERKWRIKMDVVLKADNYAQALGNAAAYLELGPLASGIGQATGRVDIQEVTSGENTQREA